MQGCREPERNSGIPVFLHKQRQGGAEMYIQVAVARKLAEYDDVLTYHVPEAMVSQIDYGSMVTVPMGRANQAVQGYVVATDVTVEAGQYKDVLAVQETETLLTPELVHLAMWMSKYYLCPCYYVLEYMLPKFARNKKQEFVVWQDDSELAMTQLLFLEPDVQTLAQLIRKE